MSYELFASIDSWPGFTNSDEICISCDKSPGSEGCKQITIMFALSVAYLD